jgi:hypothetical protein
MAKAVRMMVRTVESCTTWDIDRFRVMGGLGVSGAPEHRQLTSSEKIGESSDVGQPPNSDSDEQPRQESV